MSKFVIVSDIHGNYPALKAVIEAEGWDSEYAILGDIHGLLGYPQEVQTAVQTLDGYVLAGNHDKALFEKEEGHVVSDELSAFEYNHTTENLSEEQKEWLKELPHMKVITRSGERIALTHAMPWPEKASGYESGNSGVSKRNLVEIAATVSDDYDWVFHGHSHQQFDQDCTKFGHDVHFVNGGSLGYDHTYSVVDTDAGTVEHKSVEYDEDVPSHVQSVLPEDAPDVDKWLLW